MVQLLWYLNDSYEMEFSARNQRVIEKNMEHNFRLNHQLLGFKVGQATKILNYFKTLKIHALEKWMFNSFFFFSFFFPLKAANDKFVKEKQSGQAASERETVLKDLATAYDIYMELIGNLQEGTKVKDDSSW